MLIALLKYSYYTLRWGFPLYNYQVLLKETGQTFWSIRKQIILTCIALGIFFYMFTLINNNYPLPSWNNEFILFALISSLIINAISCYFNERKFLSLNNLLFFFITLILFVLGKILFYLILPFIFFNLGHIQFQPDNVLPENSSLEQVRDVIMNPENIRGNRVISYQGIYNRIDPGLIKNRPTTGVKLTYPMVMEGINLKYFDYEDLCKYTAASVMEYQGYHMTYKLSVVGLNILDSQPNKELPISYSTIGEEQYRKLSWIWKCFTGEPLGRTKVSVGQLTDVITNVRNDSYPLYIAHHNLGGVNERFLEDTLPMLNRNIDPYKLSMIRAFKAVMDENDVINTDKRSLNARELQFVTKHNIHVL